VQRSERHSSHVGILRYGVEPTTTCATDITHVLTAEAGLYVRVMIDLYSKPIVDWLMSRKQNRELVLKPMRMACPGAALPMIQSFNTRIAAKSPPTADTSRFSTIAR